MTGHSYKADIKKMREELLIKEKTDSLLFSLSLILRSSCSLMPSAAVPTFSSAFLSPLLPYASYFPLPSPLASLQEGNKDLHAAAVKVLTNRKVSDGTVSLCACVIYRTSPGPCDTAKLQKSEICVSWRMCAH